MQPSLRIVFMGTPQLAAYILERLLAESDVDLHAVLQAMSGARPAEESRFKGRANLNPVVGAHPRAKFEVVAVVTRPDRPRGRGLTMEPSPVAQVAAHHGLALYKPASIREQAFFDELRALAPDLLVVAAYGRILPREVLEAARLMPLNVHASLLPRHRGASPVEAAILAGDSETGVTIMRITERMDAGPILLQRAVPIAPDDTQGTLKARLAELGAQALLDALDSIAQGAIREIAQDEMRATYCKPVKKENAWIDWRADALYIERMTRAYDPWPVARSTLAGQPLLIFKAEALPHATSEALPGTIIRVEPAPVVSCGKGLLKLVEVQAAGRKRMAASDFMRGRRVAPGQRLGE
jgi:methionyl-tRNA formyltransferase